ncbi:MAG: phosphate--AMP phosphotransferase [Ruminococcaceae bacterium]|nr:phosphate--AMP phosphotransferase [Oscillospiraceae bacterium]
MLDKLNLDVTMTKEAYREEIKPLKERLAVLQHEVKNNGLPVMVIFEGWSAAGKGSVLSDVILQLDPRNFTAKSTQNPTTEEKREPFLWRHWRSIPRAGLFAIYDRSWYPEVGAARAEKLVTSAAALEKMDSINVFERQMADDGALIIKFFLHISQKEQKKRLDGLAANKSTAWRVNKEDYRNNKQYHNFYRCYDEMLERTHTTHAPWHLVPAHDLRAALAEIYRTLVGRIEAALAEKKAREAAPPPDLSALPLSAGKFTLVQRPTLEEVFLGQDMEREEYRKRLKAGQKKLAKLHNAIYLKKIPLIIAYEGWDAAGKGGNIKRLTEALDPRGYEVIPIASPTPPEKERQHLWRFWNALPKDGHIAIFDRTWYGRVLVERVEGFTTEAGWRRAYRELNEFEAELAGWGAVVLKFWLHIDKDEQLRRFKARQETPEKQWKITDEDWRNREKWDAYQVAVDDMVRLTSTGFAPWTIIESQNKLYGRIKAIETVIDAIEARV